MATYPATTNLNDLVETNPLNTEDAGLTDDIFRETRTCFKNVILKGHSNTGEHKVALIREVVTAAYGPAVGNTWNRRYNGASWSLVNYDPHSLIGGVVHNGGIRLQVAGTYLCHFSCPAYRVGANQAVLSKVTGNTPTNSTVQAWGTYASASNANTAGSNSVIDAIVTSDGTEYIGIDHWIQTANATDGFAYFTSTAPAAFPGTAIPAVPILGMTGFIMKIG